MEYKLLEENIIDLMQNFVDDENTRYKKENLLNFINDKNAYGFVACNKEQIIGFAYGYTLLRPDGKMNKKLNDVSFRKKLH